MGITKIGTFTFQTKRAAAQYIQEILHSYQPGTKLVGDDAELITLLIGLHPRSDEKFGTGIDYITTRIIEGGQPGFWITRIDGSTDDFSYRKCLSGELSHKAQVLKAMRWSIKDQIDDFRRAQFVVQTINCPLTRVALSNDRTTHVDHFNPTFAELAETYVEMVAGGFDAIVVKTTRNHPGPDLAEPHYSAFSEYHRDRAQLRLVHRSANLARVKLVID